MIWDFGISQLIQVSFNLYEYNMPKIKYEVAFNIVSLF